MSKICFDILCIIFTYDCTTVMWHMSGLSAMHTFSAILFCITAKEKATEAAIRHATGGNRDADKKED